MNEQYCQSCGMPLGNTTEWLGTNADGSSHEAYCKYCYENGQFTADVTMDEMIEICVPNMANAEHGMSEDDARKMMKAFFPTLTRWKQA